jgi:hypothetical protein
MASTPPALAGVEDARGLDVVDHLALLAELVHRPRHADPRHQLLLPGVLDLDHREILPLPFPAVADLLGPQPVSLDVGPQAVVPPSPSRPTDHASVRGELRDLVNMQMQPRSRRDRSWRAGRSFGRT